MDVFVSYRRKDVEFVKRVVDTLNAASRTVWVDWKDEQFSSAGISVLVDKAGP